MTLDTLCNRNTFVILPVVMGMNVRVALGARHPLFSVYTGVVLGILFFMTAFALYLLDFDLFLHMLGEIGDVNVAAGAGIFAVDGPGKGADGDFIAVAPQTGSRVDGHSLLSMCRKSPGDSQDQDAN